MEKKRNATQIVNEAINRFYASVYELCEVGPHQKLKRKPSALGCLNLASAEYYENKYYGTALEDKVRKYLLTDVIISLFQNKGIQCYRLKLRGTCLSARETYSYEDIIPLELIAEADRRIGIRYTGLDKNQIKRYAKDYNLSKIIRINWSGNAFSDDVKSSLYEEMTPDVFFMQYFSIGEYEMYIRKITAAIKKANDTIGIETIHKLKDRYLSGLRLETIEELIGHQYTKMRYSIMSPLNGDVASDLAQLGQLAFSEEDYEILTQNYIEKGLYKALLGREGFATCFITAEYLYRSIKEGQSLDYTAVACCYLKSVEELIYRLLEINLKYPNPDRKLKQDTLWIMKNVKPIPAERDIWNKTVRRNPDPRFDSKQVIFETGFKPYFNTTLKPMINFLHDNVNGWYISQQGQSVIYQFLENYAKDYRNDHFHKDNIEEYKVIDDIRNNTYLIFYVLLGGYKLSGMPDKDIIELGILDDSFDRFYRSIKQNVIKSQAKYILYYPGKMPIKAYRHYSQELSTYDKYGLLTPSRIRFVETDVFSSETCEKAMAGEYPDKEFFVTSKNMPEKISLVVGEEERFFSW